MALYVEIKAADGAISRTRLEAGRTRLSVRLGDTYRIYDDETGLAPQTVSVKRLDNMLIVDGLPAEAGMSPPVVEFAEFYTVCSVGSPCQLVLEGGASSPSTIVGPGTAPIGALADGSFVLYDPAYTPAAAPAASMFDSNVGRYALYGLGGLAVVGLAAGGGGGGGGNDGGPPPSDGTLRFTGPTTFNTPLPTLRGDGEPGARILVRIDNDGDGRENATYATTVDSSGRWEINLQTATAESGSLGSGLSASNVLQISQSQGSGGTQTLPSFNYLFDNVPPAAAMINPVAGNDLVNASEKNAGVQISGKAEAGSTVSVRWGTELREEGVDAEGNWTVTFPPESVPADPVPVGSPSIVTVTVIDPAGNISTPSTHSVQVITTPAQVGLTLTSADNIVNAAEVAAGIAIRGTAEAGSTVSVVWLGITHTDTADASGNWSVTYPQGEVLPHGGDGVPQAYQVTVSNIYGNTGVAASSIVIDTVPPPPPTITSIAGDGTINASEASAGFVISGTGGFVGGSISVSLNGGPAVPGIVHGSGTWSVNYPGGASPGNGIYQVVATTTDIAGNSTASAPVPATVNITPPPPPVITSVAADGVYDGLDVSGLVIIGTASPNAEVSVSVPDHLAAVTVSANADGNWQHTFTTTPTLDVLNGGSVTVQASEVNAIGNASAADTAPLFVDRVPPSAPTTIAPIYLVAEVPPFAIEVSLPDGAATIGSVIVSDGITPTEATHAGGSSWVTPFAYATPAVFTITITDQHNNSLVVTSPAPIGASFEPAEPPLALSAEMLFTSASSEDSDNLGALSQLPESTGGQWLESPTGIDSLIPFEDRSA